MYKYHICNAFSFNMIAEELLDDPLEIVMHPIEVWQVQNMIDSGFISAVGHADTAALFSTVLSREIPANRASLSLGHGDVIVVGQYIGPRLSEGATALPEGASIKWMKVSIKSNMRE